MTTEPTHTLNRLDRDIAGAATHEQKLKVAVQAVRDTWRVAIDTFFRSEIVNLVLFGGKATLKLEVNGSLTPQEWDALIAALSGLRDAVATKEPIQIPASIEEPRP